MITANLPRISSHFLPPLDLIQRVMDPGASAVTLSPIMARPEPGGDALRGSLLTLVRPLLNYTQLKRKMDTLFARHSKHSLCSSLRLTSPKTERLGAQKSPGNRITSAHQG